MPKEIDKKAGSTELKDNGIEQRFLYSKFNVRSSMFSVQSSLLVAAQLRVIHLNVRKNSDLKLEVLHLNFFLLWVLQKLKSLS